MTNEHTHKPHEKPQGETPATNDPTGASGAKPPQGEQPASEKSQEAKSEPTRHATPRSDPPKPTTGEPAAPPSAEEARDVGRSSSPTKQDPSNGSKNGPNPSDPKNMRVEVGAEMDAEVDAAMAQLGFGSSGGGGGGPATQAPAKPAQPRSPRDTVTPVTGAAPARAKPRVVQGGREHRTGKVVSVGPSDVFIEFGPKELGVVDRTQFKTEADLPQVGQDLEVAVERFEPGESIYVCSLPGQVQKAEWEMLQPGDTVEAKVTGTNKGGLELEIANHRAFMPASQVALDHIADLSVFVGQKLACRVQRIDRRGTGNIVLSRRDMLAEERAREGEKLKGTLKEGDTVTGTVRKIMPFGAFVDLGGVDGLIHISDLSHDRVNQGEKNVGRFVEVGKPVTVQILKLDWDKNRISLGLKQLQADPFGEIAQEITEGADVSGRVVRIVDFGAFIEIRPGVEGLCHISELEWRRVAHPSDVLKPDEVVQCRVLKIDPSDRKISLSIKALKEAPKREGSPGGRAGRGGRGERDDRTPEEILKETPHLRRLKEQAKQRAKQQNRGSGQGGLGDLGGLGMGLGDLKL